MVVIISLHAAKQGLSSCYDSELSWKQIIARIFPVHHAVLSSSDQSVGYSDNHEKLLSLTSSESTLR